MFPLACVTGTVTQADEVAVGASSAQFANIVAMAAGSYYILVATTDLWFKQGANPTASAAAGSCFLPKGVQACISGANGIKLAVIEDSATGKASLCQVQL